MHFYTSRKTSEERHTTCNIQKIHKPLEVWKLYWDHTLMAHELQEFQPSNTKNIQKEIIKIFFLESSLKSSLKGSRNTNRLQISEALQI